MGHKFKAVNFLLGGRCNLCVENTVHDLLVHSPLLQISCLIY